MYPLVNSGSGNLYSVRCLKYSLYSSQCNAILENSQNNYGLASHILMDVYAEPQLLATILSSVVMFGAHQKEGSR